MSEARRTLYQRHVATVPEAYRHAAAYDIVGDIHGCHAELLALMLRAGWILSPFERDADTPIHAHHPEGRLLVFVGDFADRGPGSDIVLRLAMGMTEKGTAMAVTGNHDFKLARLLHGSKVRISGGLQSTLEQIAHFSNEARDRLRDWLLGLPHQLRLPMPDGHAMAGDGYITVVHGAAPSHHLDQESRRAFERAIFAYPDEASDDGTMRRKFWAKDYEGARWIICGHETQSDARTINRIVHLDTACVFGNHLSLLRVDSGEILREVARANYAGVTKRFP